jgi:peptidoglycan/xylan/chitin deacetylase (PgdA/CDA1 family)
MKGTFLLTFDVELIWGLFFDARWRERARRRYGEVREVFPRLLELLRRHDVRATFAFVGHLFLESCRREGGVAHPDMPRPRHSFFPGDWYSFDPGTDRHADPLFYAPDLVAAVREATPRHEIGTHGFSHAFLDADRALAKAEMDAAAAAARAAGVEPRSFVYPRNLVGFTDELRGAGYTCFREAGEGGGSGPPARRGPVRRLLRTAARALFATPPVGKPRLVDGVVMVPSSAPLLAARGLRALIPAGRRVAEVRRGLRRAAAEGAVLHLWSHPHNFVEGRALMLRSLDRALGEVAAARERGEIAVATMSEVVP